MDKILLVEDDQALNRGIKLALTQDGVQVISCFLLKEAKCIFQRESIDLVLLDINLPDGDGIDLLKEIKSTQDIPVILLTAMDMETDIVTGLSSGADDYVTKPFSLAVLRARAEVQLRKKHPVQIVLVADYMFDFDRQLFEKKGEKIELSQTEQKLLRLLLKRRGSVVSREQIQAFVWGDGYTYVDDNSLSVAVRRLRTKLRDDTFIKTIYGGGYSWKG